MPIDPNIALQVGQPVQPLDPLKAYGQVLTLKNLMDQQRMQGMQEDAARAKMGREAEDQLYQSALNRTKVLSKYAAGFQQVPPEQRANVWPVIRQRLAAEGVPDMPEQMPDENLISVYASLERNPDKMAEVAQQEAQRRALAEAQKSAIGATTLRSVGAADAPAGASEPTATETGITMPTNTVSGTRAFSMDPAYYWRIADAANKDPRLAGTKYAEDATNMALKIEKDTRDAEQAGLQYVKGEDGRTYVFRNGKLEGAATSTGRDPNALFWTGEDGNPVPNTAAQNYGVKKSKAGAPSVNVGVQAYDKELNKQDAQSVSDARKGAEQAASAASDARAIAQILKGQNSGKWTEMQAALGGWLPNTPYANVTSIVSLAEGIRARAAPALRVPGSGAMSDFETKQLLGIFPQLLQSDDGRELAARVLERVADRQAIAADIKDEMVRAGKYSVKRFNDEVRARFGDGLLDPEEKKLVARMQGGKQKPAASGTQAPAFNINGLPNPAENTGRVIESEKGVRLRSDGKKWVPVQ